MLSSTVPCYFNTKELFKLSEFMYLILLIQSSLKLDYVLLILFPIEEANVIDVEQDDYVIVLI